MKLKELLKKLNEIKEEYGDELDVMLYTKRPFRSLAKKAVHSQDEGYVIKDCVWIEGV